MNPGERQVAPTIAGIRRDHVARYEWAARRIPSGARVIDVACGVGYGTRILAEAGLYGAGFDISDEALAYAAKNYCHENVHYHRMDAGAPNIDLLGHADAAVCFETIEHLEDPLPLLKALHACAEVLYASVPDEDGFPYRNHKFHFRHYTRAQFQALLEAAGWQVLEWFGQLGPESEVARELPQPPRTRIAVAFRAKSRPTLKVVAPESVPDHVAIVGLGPTCVGYFDVARRLGGASAYCDEVWGINAHGDVLRCDRVFHMDDLRIQELRAQARPDGAIASMVKWLKTHPGPVYTSVVREGYPGLVAFPLQDVLNGRYDTNGGSPYFNSTAAYAIAYAVHIGVKRISLFGIDYTLPNAHQAEKGRACCEFWLGIAVARGVEITVVEGSSLLDACEPDAARLYGYDCVDVTLRDRPDGGVEVLFADKDRIPTAAEIEARYDHQQHPNPLMRRN
jgi:SAM-dependent methyltransferase